MCRSFRRKRKKNPGTKSYNKITSETLSQAKKCNKSFIRKKFELSLTFAAHFIV